MFSWHHSCTECLQKLVKLSEVFQKRLNRIQHVGNCSYCSHLQKNKLKILKVAKWRKDEWGMMKDEWKIIKYEWRMMKDEWWRMMISSCWGVLLPNRRTDGRTFVNVESLSRLKNACFCLSDGWNGNKISM